MTIEKRLFKTRNDANMSELVDKEICEKDKPVVGGSFRCQ